MKILNLTTSDNDGECLNAIKAANALLKKSGITWFDVIGRGVVSEKPPTEEPLEISIEDMFKFIRQNAWLGFDGSFVDNIEAKYKRYGRLTARQRIRLERVYNAVKNDLTRST